MGMRHRYSETSTSRDRSNISVAGSGNENGNNHDSDDENQPMDTARRNRCRRTFVFRINDDTGSGPELVREVLLERGWTEFDSSSDLAFDAKDDWNFWWRTTHFKGRDYLRLRRWQRLNHFPCAFEISRKDYLARNMKKLRYKFPESYNFVPESYHLPTEYVTFLTECSRGAASPSSPASSIPTATTGSANERETGTVANSGAANQNSANGVVSLNSTVGWKPPNRYWICKPSDMSRGRGIHIFTELCELQHSTNCIVQRYVHNPLLLFGYKFDCRIYVLVASFRPLVFYVYDEGLVRFATTKYDLADLKDVYSHLTNTSINKQSYAYSQEKTGVGFGCKWSLTRLRHFLQSNNYQTEKVWSEIVEIIVLTILCQAVNASINVSNCFELFGFDILIDASMKPWLLEVNFCPQLTEDCPLDRQVKKPLINDLLDLLSFQDDDMRQLKPHKAGSVLPRRQKSEIKRTSTTNTGTTTTTVFRSSSSMLRGTTSARPATSKRTGSTSALDEVTQSVEFSRASTNINLGSKRPQRVSLGDRSDTFFRGEFEQKPMLPALAPDRISMNRAAILRIYGPRLLSQSVVAGSPQNGLSRSGSMIVPRSSEESASSGISYHNMQRRISAANSPAGSHQGDTGLGQSQMTAITEPSSITECFEMCQLAVQRSQGAACLYGNKSENQSVQNLDPPTRVGGFVLLFPFNAATKSVADTLDDRVIVQQLKKCVSNEVKRQQGKRTSTAKTPAVAQRPSWAIENLWDLG